MRSDGGFQTVDHGESDPNNPYPQPAAPEILNPEQETKKRRCGRPLRWEGSSKVSEFQKLPISFQNEGWGCWSERRARERVREREREREERE